MQDSFGHESLLETPTAQLKGILKLLVYIRRLVKPFMVGSVVVKMLGVEKVIVVFSNRKVNWCPTIIEF